VHLGRDGPGAESLVRPAIAWGGAAQSASMMDSLDPLVMFAEVQELTGEFPWLESDVVRDLYFRLLRTTGTMPDRFEARRYLERFAEQFTSDQLRRMLDSEARDRAKRSNPDGADLPAPARPARGQRQSLDGQEPGDPAAAELLARSSGRSVHDDAEPQAILAPARRARGLSDPGATFHRALLDAVNLGEGRLSKTAIAGRMEIDRKTLTAYIEDGLIPPPPWESLAADLTKTSHPQ
jgi:hypothetical protein